MKLSEVLEKLTGRFELTVFTGGEAACEDAGISRDEEQVDWGKVINDYDRLKDAEVIGMHLSSDRNYDGAAIWVTVKG